MNLSIVTLSMYCILSLAVAGASMFEEAKGSEWVTFIMSCGAVMCGLSVYKLICLL